MGEGEMSTLLHTNNHTARKKHQCSYCGLTINKDTNYFVDTMVGDYMYDWKYHESCLWIASKLDMLDECDDGVTMEDFINFIEEEYANFMSQYHHKLWESKHFKRPLFEFQLVFVKSQNL